MTRRSQQSAAVRDQRAVPSRAALYRRGLVQMLQLIIPVEDENLLQATLANYHIDESADLCEMYARCRTPEQQSVWLAMSAVHFFTPAGGEVTSGEFEAELREGHFSYDVLQDELRDFVCGTLECDSLPASLNSAVIPAVAYFLNASYKSK